MANKEFPPTELQLQRLRQMGIVAYSRDMSSFFCVLAVVIVVSVGSHYLSNNVSIVSTDITSYLSLSEQTPSIEIKNALGVVAALIGITLGVVLIVFFGGLLQNRFLWASSALMRPFQIVNFGHFLGVRRRGIEVLLRVALSVAIFLGGVLVVRMALLEFFNPISGVLMGEEASSVFELRSRIERIESIITSVAWAIVAIFAGIAVISRLVVVQSFRLQYSMTREEVEAELRETEPSAQMRERQRSRE